MINEKKRILLVCNYFAPENTIAAVRTSKLTKYFIKYGYAVDILTEEKKLELKDETLLEGVSNVNVFYAANSLVFIKLYNLYKKLIKPIKDKKMSNLDNRERVNKKTGNIEFYPYETAYPIIGSIEYVIEQIRQYNLAQSARKILEDMQEYDYIITSYGDSFSYHVGKYYKGKHEKVSWIFDIRDAIYRYKFTPDYVKWIPKHYERYIWRNANAIVGVSKGICRRVFKQYREKVYYISNGYDETFSQSDLGLTKKTNKMTFLYTGSMYGGLQNLSRFFEAIRFLADKKNINLSKIEFVYAGNPSAYNIFFDQAKKYKLESNCVYQGKISRGESIYLQRQADILLMASYDYKNNNGGGITGKIFEYMDAKKPVIAIVTGDVENSEVAGIISKTNIGVCYEESNSKNDFRILTEYIKKQYDHFVNEEKLEYYPNNKEVKRYDYKNIAKRYVKLLQKLEEGN